MVISNCFFCVSKLETNFQIICRSILRMTTEIEQELCGVCLEPFHENGGIVTKCNHKFHSSCLLQCYNPCPYCRAQLLPNEMLPQPKTLYDDYLDYIYELRQTQQWIEQDIDYNIVPVRDIKYEQKHKSKTDKIMIKNLSHTNHRLMYKAVQHR